MSKKNRIKKQRERAAQERQPEQCSGISRRTLVLSGGAGLVVLAGIGAIRALLKRQGHIEQDPTKRGRTQSPQPQPAPKRKGPEYSEWSKKISLPIVDFDAEEELMEFEEMEARCIPPQIDRDDLHTFYESFDTELTRFRNEIE